MWLRWNQLHVGQPFFWIQLTTAYYWLMQTWLWNIITTQRYDTSSKRRLSLTITSVRTVRWNGELEWHGGTSRNNKHVWFYRLIFIHQEHLKIDCKKSQVHCPNNCGNDVARESLPKHLKDECLAIQLTCPYSKYGCAYTGSRIEYNKHLIEDTDQHVKLIDELTTKRALETSSKDSEIQALGRELILTKQCLEQL